MSTIKTVSDLRDHYLAFNQRLEESTKGSYKRAISAFIRRMGDLELKRLSVEHAEQFQLWLCNRYPSRTTVNIYMKSCRAVFNYGKRRGLIPGDMFAVEPMKVVEERKRVYSDAETNRLLEAANSMWRTRILFGYVCGMRRGEVLNLTFSDVDEERMVVHVQSKRQTSCTWQWYTKNKTSRSLPITKAILSAVKQRRHELPPEQEYICLSESRCWRVLNMQRLGTLTERIRKCPDECFTRPYKRILRKAKIADGTFHDLRRSYGTQTSAKVPMPILAYLMGHADIKTTAKYYIKNEQAKNVEAAREAINTIGVAEFESAASASPRRRSNQAELHPVSVGLNY